MTSAREIAINQLARVCIEGGPSKMDLLEALFFNRDKILRFKPLLNCEAPFIRLDSLFPTKEIEQYYLVGRSMTADGEVCGVQGKRIGIRNGFQRVVMAYDSQTRRGSWCPLYDEILVMNLCGQKMVPFTLRN